MSVIRQAHHDLDPQIVHFIFNRYEPTRLRAVSSLLLLVPFILSVLFVHHSTEDDSDVDFDEEFYPSLPSAILTSFAIFNVALLTSLVAYRLSPFHPLARYPGPILAKVSQLYMVYVVLRNRPAQYLWFQRQHDKYGDAVRIGVYQLHPPRCTETEQGVQARTRCRCAM